MLHSDVAWMLEMGDAGTALAEGVAVYYRVVIEAVPMADRVAAAAAEYVARRDRQANVPGKIDRSGRFYPAPGEVCSCCADIRPPSKAWPYSLLIHCRSAEHVATRHGLEATNVRKAARAIDKARKQAQAATVAA